MVRMADARRAAGHGTHLPHIDPRFVHDIRPGTDADARIHGSDRYGAFFHDHFAWLASAIVYIAIVLTAMQVGLAAESLGHNKAFQSASYGFTVFSILGPLIAASVIVLQFYSIFLWNWMKAFHQKEHVTPSCTSHNFK
ncbi:hypothetical protein CRV24_007446 [Beauveria bassiana]|nr:hypothetical protein CRV24_007446 [Beauveria bassiana]KAH8712364.1 hypothetical protein HC256_005560 [Beauveria bassiana]